MGGAFLWAAAETELKANENLATQVLLAQKEWGLTVGSSLPPRCPFTLATLEGEKTAYVLGDTVILVGKDDSPPKDATIAWGGAVHMVK